MGNPVSWLASSDRLNSWACSSLVPVLVTAFAALVPAQAREPSAIDATRYYGNRSYPASVAQRRLDLPAHTQVRLTIELLEEDAQKMKNRDALTALENLWRQSKIHSTEERLTRDQLHERR